MATTGTTTTARSSEAPARARAFLRWAVAGTAAAALVAGASAARGASEPSALQPESLAHARAIRAETEARYRRVPGRKLAIEEASPMGVIGSLTLATLGPDVFRVVPTDNGIYFGICPARARCPYPLLSASWPAVASLPRRQALELAVRAFAETRVDLVVVALPTAEPLWAVFERADFLAAAAAEAALVHLSDDPAVANRLLRESVDRLVLPRLHRPIPILPPSLETIVAVPYAGR